MDGHPQPQHTISEVEANVISEPSKKANCTKACDCCRYETLQIWTCIACDYWTFEII